MLYLPRYWLVVWQAPTSAAEEPSKATIITFQTRRSFHIVYFFFFSAVSSKGIHYAPQQTERERDKVHRNLLLHLKRSKQRKPNPPTSQSHREFCFWEELRKLPRETDKIAFQLQFNNNSPNIQWIEGQWVFIFLSAGSRITYHQKKTHWPAQSHKSLQLHLIWRGVFFIIPSKCVESVAFQVSSVNWRLMDEGITKFFELFKMNSEKLAN